ncbi:leng8, partial [Symbiodinium microadriaticum]
MKEQERHKPIASIVSGGTKGKKRQRVAPLPAATTTTTLTEFDLEQLIVVGTCQKVEKDYLRLTSAPDPSTVRPLEVLRRSLELAKNKWATNKDAPECYVYMCSQLKSLRQDLMVQHIRTEFTVDVYEFHARVALESSDLNEYNQCQTQLKQMYTSGLPGSEMEFTAYRILYYLYLQGNKKYQQGSQDLAHLMAALPQAAFEHPAVKHALAMRESMLLENYHRFFRLYRDTPNLGNCILDMMLDSWRVKALQRIIRAYKPVIAVEFVAQELSFDSIEECVEFVIPL